MFKLEQIPLFKTSGLLIMLGATAGFAPIPTFNMGSSGSIPSSDTDADKADCHGNTPACPADYSEMDRNLVRQVKSSIQSDRSLSTFAHSIQVIAYKGEVTLRGPVQSEAESLHIEADAEDVVGMDGVVNDLSIKAAKAH